MPRQRFARTSTQYREHEAPALGPGLWDWRDARGRCAARVLISSGCADDTSRKCAPPESGAGSRQAWLPWVPECSVVLDAGGWLS